MWRGRYSARPTPFYSARIYDPVFAKTSPRRSFSVIENERFGLVFAKTGSINSGTSEYLLQNLGYWSRAVPFFSLFFLWCGNHSEIVVCLYLFYFVVWIIEILHRTVPFSFIFCGKPCQIVPYQVLLSLLSLPRESYKTYVVFFSICLWYLIKSWRTFLLIVARILVKYRTLSFFCHGIHVQFEP
jgi:hypothetical protein